MLNQDSTKHAEAHQFTRAEQQMLCRILILILIGLTRSPYSEIFLQHPYILIQTHLQGNE
jgi:hypothetical protein